MNNQIGLKSADVREAIQGTGLKIKNQGLQKFPNSRYEFEISDDYVSFVELPYEKRFGMKILDTPESMKNYRFGKAVVSTRMIEDEYQVLPEPFWTILGDLEDNIGIERVEFVSWGSIDSIKYKKEVGLFCSSEAEEAHRKQMLQNSIRNLLGLTHFVDINYKEILKNEKERQEKILQTSSDELIRNLQKYGYGGEKGEKHL